MDLLKNKNITRKNFVKGLAGAAVGCACLSLNCFNDSDDKEDDKTDDGNNTGGSTAKVYLAGACGIYCGSCPAYIHKHGEYPGKSSSEPAETSKTIPTWINSMKTMSCDGCLSGGTLASHCQTCNVRLCALNQADDRCTNCASMPCSKMTTWINEGGGYQHRKVWVPNLEKIKEVGAEAWVTEQEELWACPKCGWPMSWYDTKCVKCGEPRSAALNEHMPL